MSAAPKAASSGGPKKRFYAAAPSPSPVNTSHAADLRVLHQTTELSLLYLRHPQSSWSCRGRTSLYVINEAASDTNKDKFALHLRRTCRVVDIQVHTVKQQSESAASLVSLPVSYKHIDPLAHVLVKPAQTYNDQQKEHGYDADSQCSRGAGGMTTALRTASAASHMGELRVSIQDDDKGPAAKRQKIEQPAPAQASAASTVLDCWKDDLTRDKNDGEVAQELTHQLRERSTPGRNARIQLVAQRLSQAKTRVLKITIEYEVALDRMPHLGGIHSSHGPTPHAYTTVGVVGDHEGPRSWIPCLDSASSKHRASHELVLKVTAPMRDGLSAVGCGEDFGVSKTLLHDLTFPDSTEAYSQLGEAHVNMVKKTVEASLSRSTQESEDGSAPHLIPPDPSSIDSILATTVWATQIWTPSPARSLGFAVGPFKVLEDPEYLSQEVVDEDDSDSENKAPPAADREDVVKSMHENGEGIRQVYFAPLYERKYIHVNADTMLLQNTEFEIPPLGRRQMEQSRDLDQTVLASTVGVPHRALSLFRDVLALPTYRTCSYTQVWIPNAVHGGSTSGALHCCPEVLINPFLGGSIMDSTLLPPVGSRLPYYNGGRVLQMLQARCAVRGWITSALPLGERDDVGFGYILTLIESFLMSIYERGHGAHGEGGAKGGVFFTRRYAAGSGLNSTSLDFLPVANIEEGELDVVVGGIVGAIPIEDQNSDQFWRTASNGSESHSSALDELFVRQMLYKDVVEAVERGTDKDKAVPLPAMGWMGSYLSLSSLSSNATSSSDLGCGALELVHPVGGVTYRALKTEVLRRMVEGRAGVATFVRLIRAAFIAAHLEDIGEKELNTDGWLKKPKQKKPETQKPEEKDQPSDETQRLRPPFLLCVDELLKKNGLTHTLFTRALRILAGPIREPHLRGTLVDVERETRMPGSGRQYVEPEGFPNSYVRGASGLYLRVGTHVEFAGDMSASGHGASAASSSKNPQLQIIAEPVIPEGGNAYGGPITVRVVENGGKLRDVVRTMNIDGARVDWGPPIFLNADPVTTKGKQTAVSGTIESSSKASKDTTGNASEGGKTASETTQLNAGPFTDACLHSGGFQAIELIRLTNRSPLLWVRVDPMGIYGGRISVYQPDACLAEQLFHDGDAEAQVDALRALAERPFRIQGSVKVENVHDVKVSELPVRVLADCLRGSPALHSSLPHTPVVRAQAALAIAQWQNNKAPLNNFAVGADWTGLQLLLQYFRERFHSEHTAIPVTFTRVVLKKDEEEGAQSATKEGVGMTAKTREAELYQYLDMFEDEHERRAAIEEAVDMETEEDEEYRVRCAVIQAIASVRAKNGMTPPAVLSFLEEVLTSGDAFTVGSLQSGDDGSGEKHGRKRADSRKSGKKDLHKSDSGGDLKFVPSMIVADTLLALCHVNVAPATDPATGKFVQSNAKHPILPLIKASHRWLEWELYRETIRFESEATTMSGIGGSTHSTVAACAVTALYSLSILRQSTTDPVKESPAEGQAAAKPTEDENLSDLTCTAQFYINIFDEEPFRSDLTRAACAQAVACICCAADRFGDESTEALGLLSALEFLLERIMDSRTSPGLRQTLALLMLDSCTGKVCSTQRVGAVGGRNDLSTSAARLLTGPLGASHGGDNGSALLTAVAETSNPAANAVNDGARRGLRLLSRAGHPRETSSNQVYVRVAILASSLWRTINGDNAPPPSTKAAVPAPKQTDGICANDGYLRCTLLNLWQWIWPKGCFALLRVQSWKSLEGTQQYKDLGAEAVMKIADEEKDAASAEEASLAGFNNLVGKEIDRQRWRGERARLSYEYYKEDKKGHVKDTTGAADAGIGQPLPPIERDNAFKQGGWIASAAQQRRRMALDGGTQVSKIRITMKKD